MNWFKKKEIMTFDNISDEKRRFIDSLFNDFSSFGVTKEFIFNILTCDRFTNIMCNPHMILINRAKRAYCYFSGLRKHFNNHNDMKIFAVSVAKQNNLFKDIIYIINS
jgi:hypothetical protein